MDVVFLHVEGGQRTVLGRVRDMTVLPRKGDVMSFDSASGAPVYTVNFVGWFLRDGAAVPGVPPTEPNKEVSQVAIFLTTDHSP